MARYCGGCARRRGPGDTPCPRCATLGAAVPMSGASRAAVRNKWQDIVYRSDTEARDAEYVAEHGAAALVTKKAYDEEVLGDLF